MPSTTPSTTTIAVSPTDADIPAGGDAPGHGDTVRGALRNCPQLRGLGGTALEVLAACSTRRGVRAGSAVFRTGDPGDAMYVLIRGEVVARLRSPDGEAVDLGVSREGDAFGHLEILAPAPRTADAVAVRDTTLVVTPAPAALRALRASPEALMAVSADLVHLVRALHRATAGRVFHPVPVRVAGLLLELAGPDDRVTFVGSQSLLAQRLGIARQTLNSALRHLAAQGLIRVHPGGRTVTVDRAGMTALFGDGP